MYPLYPSKLPFATKQAVCNPYFGLVDDAGTDLVHPPYSCKEYLLDYVYMTHNKDAPCMYAITTNKKACLTELRVMVGCFEFIENSLDLINQVESHLNIENSLLFVLPNNDKAHVFRGSPKWMIAPPMLSFYSLLVRAGRVHKKNTSYKETFDKMFVWKGLVGGYPPPDSAIWRGGMPAIKAIMEHGYEEIFGKDVLKNWPRCNDIHMRGINMMGIGYYKKAMPHWYNHIEVPPTSYMAAA
jgi:hypothetical protein